MSQFQNCFAAYGADYHATMERFMGNESMYLRFLDMLFQDENLQKLGHSLQTGDWMGAFEAAHTLKGVAGNMGLTPLYEAVCEIVEPLRSKTEFDYGLKYQVILQEFEKADAFRSQLKNCSETAGK